MTVTIPARSAPELPPLKETLRRLSSAQKGAQGAPAYSRFVNRPLGRLLAALAFHAGLTPNVVTAISALFTFGGIAVISLATPALPMALVVAGCLALGYGLDAADGQLARLRGGGSPSGEWLDHMFDAAKTSALHLAVLVQFYRFGPVEPVWLLVPLGYCLVAAVTYFATMLNEALRAQHGVATRAQPTAQRPGVTRSLLTLPNDYGVLIWVFVLLGAPSLFVPAYTLLFLGATAFLTLASVKWFSEMDGLPR